MEIFEICQDPCLHKTNPHETCDKNKDTPGTRGGPGGRDRTLAVKRRNFVLI